MPFNLSTGELLVLMVVAVCVFGGRLPQVARKVGGAISEFKRGMRAELNRIDHDVGPPPEWERPPDGENCEGLGDTEPADPPKPADSEPAAES